MKTFTQIEIFHLTLQTKLPIEILKMLIFNISFVSKKRSDTKTIKFQFDFTNRIIDENIKNSNI
jgi:hypothetical protein